MHGVDNDTSYILRFKRVKRNSRKSRLSTPHLNTAPLGSWGESRGVEMYGVDKSDITDIALQTFEAR
jgi:hypothetical protein